MGLNLFQILRKGRKYRKGPEIKRYIEGKKINYNTFSHVTSYIETNYKGKRSFSCSISKLGACCKANKRVIALCHPVSHNKTVNLSAGHTVAKVAVINFS
jgi:hypothetical protein